MLKQVEDLLALEKGDPAREDKVGSRIPQLRTCVTMYEFSVRCNLMWHIAQMLVFKSSSTALPSRARVTSACGPGR